MNGFTESQTPREFEEDEWRFLIVADKYQTGFDQPLFYRRVYHAVHLTSTKPLG